MASLTLKALQSDSWDRRLHAYILEWHCGFLTICDVWKLELRFKVRGEKLHMINEKTACFCFLHTQDQTSSAAKHISERGGSLNLILSSSSPCITLQIGNRDPAKANCGSYCHISGSVGLQRFEFSWTFSKSKSCATGQLCAQRWILEEVKAWIGFSRVIRGDEGPNPENTLWRASAALDAHTGGEVQVRHEQEILGGRWTPSTSKSSIKAPGSHF